MSIKPILFNTDMVRAIQNDQKTVTRRLIKQYVPQDAKFGYTGFTPEGCISGRGTYADGWGEKFYRLPYRPGDILWVRETWAHPSIYEIWAGADPGMFLYKADDPLQPAAHGKWHPSIHMPREAARIFLRVTSVRGERLHDITIAGLQSEGVLPQGWVSQYGVMTSAKEYFLEFEKLWDSTIKPADLSRYGWAANPPVLVNEFERCEKPKEWCK